MVEPKQLLVVKHDNIIIIDLETFAAKAHGLRFLTVSFLIAFLGLDVKAGNLSDYLRQGLYRQALAHVARNSLKTCILRLDHVKDSGNHTFLCVLC